MITVTGMPAMADVPAMTSVRGLTGMRAVIVLRLIVTAVVLAAVRCRFGRDGFAHTLGGCLGIRVLRGAVVSGAVVAGVPVHGVIVLAHRSLLCELPPLDGREGRSGWMLGRVRRR
ncbi:MULTISPECIES: hypothetical protein [Microbacterium]|uniref:Uncharacterized protein n=1 Tax=Microbacterium sediminis TaxID=904291 RepID=A0A1B9N8F3_9MICO|nr:MULTISPECIES: hypothetical protein [Microbacterium]OCG72879.1 hypothetical protein A7J15_10290 [Microbacterium sediminis]